MSCTRVLAAVLLISFPIVAWGRVAPRYLGLVNAGLRAADPQDYDGIDCGASYETCPEGQCCSESGFCGTGVDYCKSPQCQMQYTQGTCDGSQRPCGSDTLNVPRSSDSNVPIGALIESCEVGIALTFDDGPWSYTPDLLDMLRERGHKATFFITGFNNGKTPIDTPGSAELQSVRRIHADGHQIASHTWSHQRLTEVGPDIREQQVVYNEMALRNIFGFFPRYIRPPYGSCDSECLSYLGLLGYHVLGWSVDSEDWKNDTPDDIEKSKRIIDAVFADAYPPRLIILTHDTHFQTVYNLTSYILDRIEALEQKSITVGECLKEPPEKWYHNAMANADAGEQTSPCSAAVVAMVDNVNSCLPMPSTIPDTDLIVTTDGTCGFRSSGMYGCWDSTYGDCCSYNGYCGSSSAYCDGRCQLEFGACNEIVPSNPLTTSANGLCGEDSHQTCQGSSYGGYSSRDNFCGETEEYCLSSHGCQSSFGACL